MGKIFSRIIGDANWSSKNINQSNAANAVLIEAINYCIQINPTSDLIKKANVVLVSFLNTQNPNSKYLALETMAHIAATGDPLELLVEHRESVMIILRDSDISIQKRALDLLYSMCKPVTFKETINGLLGYITEADPELKEEMVLKIAVVAEKYVSEYTWYVDAMIRLVSIAGDVVGDSLWHRIIQIVLGHEDLREYASYTVLQALKQPECGEVATKIAAYILGEYGSLIVDSPGCTPFEQFAAMQEKFSKVSNMTKAIILTAYLKFANTFPTLKSEIVAVFKKLQYSLDIELQQRSCEYLAILESYTDELLAAVCEEMPPFADRDSGLLSQMTKKLNDTDDLRTWIVGGLQDQTRMLKNRPHMAKNVFTTPQTGSPPKAKSTSNPGLSFFKLLSTPNGILYEDQNIQIGIKSEYHGSFGKLGLYVGNKSKSPIANFRTKYVINPPYAIELSNANEVIPTIAGEAQQVLLLNIEAKQFIEVYPKLLMAFDINNLPISLSIDLPINLLKFSLPCQLTAEDFFNRWRQLSDAEQEIKLEISPPKNTVVNIDFCKSLFAMCNLELIDADKNPNNLCCAAIYMGTVIGQVGYLVRLESNTQHKVTQFLIKAIPGHCQRLPPHNCSANSKGIDSFATKQFTIIDYLLFIARIFVTALPFSLQTDPSWVQRKSLVWCTFHQLACRVCL